MYQTCGDNNMVGLELDVLVVDKAIVIELF